MSFDDRLAELAKINAVLAEAARKEREYKQSLPWPEREHYRSDRDRHRNLKKRKREIEASFTASERIELERMEAGAEQDSVQVAIDRMLEDYRQLEIPAEKYVKRKKLPED